MPGPPKDFGNRWIVLYVFSVSGIVFSSSSAGTDPFSNKYCKKEWARLLILDVRLTTPLTGLTYTMDRVLVVKKIIALMLSLFAGAAHAGLLTFDDLVAPTSGSYNMPSYPGYSGPSYHGFLFSTNLDAIGVGGGIFYYGAHSGYFALLNNNRGTGYIFAEGGADFTFEGLWAKRWATAPESGGDDSLFGNISGHRDGVMVWSVDTSLNGSYEYYAPQIGLIDELRLNLGNSFLVDDIVLGSTSPVPLPAAFWLFGSGLLGIFGFSRTNMVRSRQATI